VVWRSELAKKQQRAEKKHLRRLIYDARGLIAQHELTIHKHVNQLRH
jgi:hypothetical protein